jgi:hypothetical protein
MAPIASVLLALLGSAVPVHSAEPAEIEVRVDPRVELLSVVFRLAGNPEYNQAEVPPYATAADLHFAGFRDHPAVQRARSMRRSHGVSFDACMSMAIHLPGTEEVAGAVSFSPRPPALDSRWQPADATAFLTELQDFVEESAFDEFLVDHEGLYRHTRQELEEVLRENIRMGWFEEFFGGRPEATFTVIPGLLNGGASYGPRVRHPDGREELFSILGVWKTDAEGWPRFDADIVHTVVHEFSHSFCNALVEEHLAELRPAAERIWPHVEAAMRDQAYGTWEIMMKEALVRASTARYAAVTRGEAAHARAVDYERSRGFEWTGELSALLAGYEGRRDEFATLGDFMPEVVRFFHGYADELVELREGRSEDGPARR